MPRGSSVTASRRGFLGGLIGIIAAPAIVRVENLMVLAPRRKLYVPGQYEDHLARRAEKIRSERIAWQEENPDGSWFAHKNRIGGGTFIKQRGLWTANGTLDEFKVRGVLIGRNSYASL